MTNTTTPPAAPAATEGASLTEHDISVLSAGLNPFRTGVEGNQARKVLQRLSESLATTAPASVQPVLASLSDAEDAARWRRLVNASELPFPVLTIADDPENDCLLTYGRKRLEELVDRCDEIPCAYPAAALASSTPTKK